MILFTDLQIKGVLMEIYVYAFQGFKIAAAKISCSLAGQLLYVAIGHKKGSRARRIINSKKRWIYREDTEVVSLVILQQYKSIIC